ncbi:MAG: histidine kinase [Ideonella sp.]|nr:histidine kinase [Ideonella sp.]
MTTHAVPHGAPNPSRLQRFGAAAVRAYHAYATWLVGISWKRFFLFAILLLVFVGIVHDMPPFTWKVSETVEVVKPRPPKKAIAVDKPVHYSVTIDENGIRIRPADAASAPASAASAPSGGLPSISIDLPPGSQTDEIRRAVEEAREALEEAANDAREAAAEAAAEADGRPRTRIVTARLGDSLPPLALLFIIVSIVIKATYKGRLQAEVKAAQATVTAEAETLKRQVVEARMAAMQAQVEPHFLFNTLASIDHLIETDAARASKMQKNLIALLRASMPTLREADTNLGRELAVIRPYLEILKVRMEERLQTEIRVSDGLLSAEFPPMMLQSLVENAIKHGLEPKADGGTLIVAAEVVHGDLAVSVADSGLGFGQAATAGTGVGLANIRERLQLLYGGRAQLSVTETPGGGTTVTITVPYVSKPRPGASTT